MTKLSVCFSLVLCGKLHLLSGRHQAYYKSTIGQRVHLSNGKEFTFLENELVKIEESYKVNDSPIFSYLENGY